MSKANDELSAFLAFQKAHNDLVDHFSFANARRFRAALYTFLNFGLPPDKKLEPLVKFFPRPANDDEGGDAA